MINKLHEIISYYLHVFLFYLFRLFPIKNNKVVICNYIGKGYGDNGKYICEELIKDGVYDIVWAVSDKNIIIPNGIRKVRIGSVGFIFEMVTSKIWIDNCRKFDYVIKRKGQYYIQSWHGDIGPKKIELEAINTLPASYIKQSKHDSSMIDLMLSGIQYFTDRIPEVFGFNGEILKCGYPRRDIFYKKDNQLTSHIKRNLGIDEDCKIVLYAPTFRDKLTDDSVYNLPWSKVLEACVKRFGGKWIGISRMHPNISYLAKQYVNSDVIDVTDYEDMQQLMLISDICISDYSSSIFDFCITKKPGFYYAVDYQQYKMSRDVLFELDQTPFPLAQSEEELIYQIINFDEYKYENEWYHFYRDWMGLYNEGNASRIVADRIKKICGE